MASPEQMEVQEKCRGWRAGDYGTTAMVFAGQDRAQERGPADRLLCVSRIGWWHTCRRGRCNNTSMLRQATRVSLQAGRSSSARGLSAPAGCRWSPPSPPPVAPANLIGARTYLRAASLCPRSCSPLPAHPFRSGIKPLTVRLCGQPYVETYMNMSRFIQVDHVSYSCVHSCIVPGWWRAILRSPPDRGAADATRALCCVQRYRSVDEFDHYVITQVRAAAASALSGWRLHPAIGNACATRVENAHLGAVAGLAHTKGSQTPMALRPVLQLPAPMAADVGVVPAWCVLCRRNCLLRD